MVPTQSAPSQRNIQGREGDVGSINGQLLSNVLGSLIRSVAKRITILALGETSSDGTGGDNVDVDVVGHQLLLENFKVDTDAVLGGLVGGNGEEVTVTVDATNDSELTGTALLHLINEGQDGVAAGQDVEVEDLIDILGMKSTANHVPP